MGTHNIFFILKKIEKMTILCFLTLLYHQGLNYPCLEQSFIVLRVFESLKFDCISIFFSVDSNQNLNQLWQLCTARKAWSDLVIRSALVRFGN